MWSFDKNPGKSKSYFNNFWMVVVRSGHGLLGLGTLKSAVYRDSIDELGSFFGCWYKYRKAKSCFRNSWVDMVKNWWGLIDHETFMPDVFHKWFDALNRLIEWFLHADSGGIIFYSTLYLWYLNAGWPLQLYLVRGFRKNCLFAKMTTK